MDPREARYISAHAADYLDKLCGADSPEAVMSLHKQLCDVIDVKPTNFPDFFPKVMATITASDAQDLLNKYKKRAAQKCYENGKACVGTKVLVIGAGPCGLRTAIEAQMLGAKVVLIEKRQNFSRNNVLHLWPFVITDLKALGAKKFYGKFCPGAIDHISIAQIQLILLKIAVILGVEVHFGIEYSDLREPTEEGGKVRGWRAALKPEKHPLNNYEFDVLIGADGRRNTLTGFKRKVLRGKLAIAITANFVNKRSAAEAKVQEISGVSFIFKQDFFNELCAASGIDLENIVYYKDETHYFVMTAKKHSLLWKGVLLEDYPETNQLLSPDNIDRKALEDYIIEAVNFSTNNKLPNPQFALNSRGEPDIALIDFTEMYQAENACRVVQRKGRKLLVGLVGDSLLEPFWPTGSGCARGFLSSLDMCWSIRSWAKKPKAPVEVIAERESIYRLLAQTTHENLSKDYNSYTVEPQTRYPYINLSSVKPYQVKNLLDSDEAPRNESSPLSVSAKEKKTSSDGAGESKTTKPAGVVRGTNGKVQPKAATVTQQQQPQQDEELPDLDEMLPWFRNQVEPYGVKVEGIQDVFINGDVLCAILHRFRPDLLPEYPLPPEVQQGDDETEMAAFRNQLAFDFLRGEYSLVSEVGGAEATTNFSANLSKLIDYTVKVYNTFRLKKPFSIVKPQINISPAPSYEDYNNTQGASPYTLEPHCRAKSEPGGTKAANEASMGNGYVSSVWTSTTNFVTDDNSNANEEDDDEWNHGGRQVRRSNSIQRMVQRLNSNSSSGPTRTRVAPAYQDDDDSDDETYFAPSNVYANPYRTISNEIRKKRLEEADKSKVETLKLVHMLQSRKKEMRDEERAKEREQFIKAVRAQQLNEPAPETSSANYRTVESDDFFNEYNMRLWRNSRPSMDDRTKFLETKLFNAGLERNSSFSEPRKEPGKLEPAKPGLFRSATERQIKGQSLPSSVQWLRKTNKVAETIGQEFAKNHGHVSLSSGRGDKEKKERTPEIPMNRTGAGIAATMKKLEAKPAEKKPEVKHTVKKLEVKHPEKKPEVKSVEKRQDIKPTVKTPEIRPAQKFSAVKAGVKNAEVKAAPKKPEVKPAVVEKSQSSVKQLKATTTVEKSQEPYSAYFNNSSIRKGGNLQKSPTTASISSREGKGTSKKDDIGDYLRAKELMKSKSTIFKPMKVSQESTPPPEPAKAQAEPRQNSIIMQAKQNCDNKVTAKYSLTSQRKGSLGASSPQQNPLQSVPLVKDRATFEMKTTPPPPPPTYNRQTTIDEFDDLLSEADEYLSELDPKELDHLAAWAENTFSTARGVEVE